MRHTKCKLSHLCISVFPINLNFCVLSVAIMYICVYNSVLLHHSFIAVNEKLIFGTGNVSRSFTKQVSK